MIINKLIEIFSISLAILSIQLAKTSAQFISDEYTSYDFVLTEPDIVATTSNSELHLTDTEFIRLEAFRAKNNERILLDKDSSLYNQLQWASIGYPRLIETAKSSNESAKIFHFDSTGFYVYFYMLTDSDRTLLMDAFKQKTSIDLIPSQIVDLFLERFECTINFFNVSGKACIYKGKVTNFNQYPLRMAFNAPNGTDERHIFDSFIEIAGENKIQMECTITTKETRKLADVFTLLPDDKLVEKLFGRASDKSYIYVTPSQVKSLAHELYESLKLGDQYELSVLEFARKFLPEFARLTSPLQSFSMVSYDETLIESMSPYGSMFNVAYNLPRQQLAFLVDQLNREVEDVNWKYQDVVNLVPATINVIKCLRSALKRPLVFSTIEKYTYVPEFERHFHIDTSKVLLHKNGYEQIQAIQEHRMNNLIEMLQQLNASYLEQSKNLESMQNKVKNLTETIEQIDRRLVRFDEHESTLNELESMNERYGIMNSSMAGFVESVASQLAQMKQQTPSKSDFDDLKTQLEAIEANQASINQSLENIRHPSIETLDSFVLDTLQKRTMFRELLLNSNKSDLVNRKWTLIYRGTSNGFGANDFHHHCDHIEGTLTIVRVKHNNYIFGGYTSVAWDSPVFITFKWDSKAFIFSLVNGDDTPLILNTINPSRSIECDKDYGPVFGAGYDFYLSTFPNINNCQSGLGATYKHPKYEFKSNSANSFLAGSKYFLLSEIEVFKIG